MISGTRIIRAYPNTTKHTFVSPVSSMLWVRGSRFMRTTTKFSRPLCSLAMVCLRILPASLANYLTKVCMLACMPVMLIISATGMLALESINDF